MTEKWKLTHSDNTTEYFTADAVHVTSHGELMIGKLQRSPGGQPTGIDADIIVAPGFWKEARKSRIV